MTFISNLSGKRASIILENISCSLIKKKVIKDITNIPIAKSKIKVVIELKKIVIVDTLISFSTSSPTMFSILKLLSRLGKVL